MTPSPVETVTAGVGAGPQFGAKTGRRSAGGQVLILTADQDAARCGVPAALGDVFWSLANGRALAPESGGDHRGAAQAVRSVAEQVTVKATAIRPYLVDQAVALESRASAAADTPGPLMPSNGFRCAAC